MLYEWKDEIICYHLSSKINWLFAFVISNRVLCQVKNIFYQSHRVICNFLAVQCIFLCWRLKEASMINSVFAIIIIIIICPLQSGFCSSGLGARIVCSLCIFCWTFHEYDTSVQFYRLGANGTTIKLLVWIVIQCDSMWWLQQHVFSSISEIYRRCHVVFVEFLTKKRQYSHPLRAIILKVACFCVL